MQTKEQENTKELPGPEADAWLKREQPPIATSTHAQDREYILSLFDQAAAGRIHRHSWGVDILFAVSKAAKRATDRHDVVASWPVNSPVLNSVGLQPFGLPENVMYRSEMRYAFWARKTNVFLWFRLRLSKLDGHVQTGTHVLLHPWNNMILFEVPPKDAHALRTLLKIPDTPLNAKDAVEFSFSALKQKRPLDYEWLRELFNFLHHSAFVETAEKPFFPRRSFDDFKLERGRLVNRTQCLVYKALEESQLPFELAFMVADYAIREYDEYRVRIVDGQADYRAHGDDDSQKCAFFQFTPTKVRVWLYTDKEDDVETWLFPHIRIEADEDSLEWRMTTDTDEKLSFRLHLCVEKQWLPTVDDLLLKHGYVTPTF